MSKQDLIDEINSKDIAEDVRERALAAIERIASSGEANWGRTATKIYHFIWSVTAEGHDFWSDINNAPKLLEPRQPSRPKPTIAALDARIAAQDEAEVQRWQRRMDELAEMAATTDRSKPFIGAADAMYALRGTYRKEGRK